jgi:3-hydroxymyristoyl/3-hydroxydecanoyl-(acyl carrier protein) dehydratase
MEKLRSFPIQVQSLVDSLPHRAPMIWVSRVMASDENSSHCEADLERDGPQFDSLGLRQSSVVELMAQSLGYSQAALSNEKAQKAYLVSLKDIRYSSEEVWNAYSSTGGTVAIYLSVIKILGPLSLISGVVKTREGVLLAEGTFKCFKED